MYEREDGLERVWEYEIMPLLADLFYGQRDLGEQYGLAEPARGIEATCRLRPAPVAAVTSYRAQRTRSGPSRSR